MFTFLLELRSKAGTCSPSCARVIRVAASNFSPSNKAFAIFADIVIVGTGARGLHHALTLLLPILRHCGVRNRQDSFSTVLLCVERGTGPINSHRAGQISARNSFRKSL